MIQILMTLSDSGEVSAFVLPPPKRAPFITLMDGIRGIIIAVVIGSQLL